MINISENFFILPNKAILNIVMDGRIKDKERIYGLCVIFMTQFCHDV